MENTLMEAINRLVLVYGAERISEVSLDDKISVKAAAAKYIMTERDIESIREFTDIKRQSKKIILERLKRKRWEYVNPNPKPAPKKPAKVKHPGPGASITAMESRLQELVAHFAK